MTDELSEASLPPELRAELQSVTIAIEQRNRIALGKRLRSADPLTSEDHATIVDALGAKRGDSAPALKFEWRGGGRPPKSMRGRVDACRPVTDEDAVAAVRSGDRVELLRYWRETPLSKISRNVRLAMAAALCASRRGQARWILTLTWTENWRPSSIFTLVRDAWVILFREKLEEHGKENGRVYKKDVIGVVANEFKMKDSAVRSVLDEHRKPRLNRSSSE